MNYLYTIKNKNTKFRTNKLYYGDCLEVLKRLPTKSINFVLTDLPYGNVTDCKWDILIPFKPMWKELNRIIKIDSVIALFGIEPFSSTLRISNIKNYKYDWVWNKVIQGSFTNAKYKPLSVTENISIFTHNNSKTHNYYPIMTKRELRIVKKTTLTSSESAPLQNKDGRSRIYNTRYPKTLLTFSNANRLLRCHPTQKPIRLLEYLIRTYTSEYETVLDFTMGSGSTGVACKNLDRSFIGIENDKEIFETAEQRIKFTTKHPELLI